MITLTSAQLTYRELQPEDISARYIGWLNNPEVNKYLETRFATQDEASVRAFVTAQKEDPDSTLFRIGLAEDDTHIGNIKLGPINRLHKTGQISLIIGEQAQYGKGYAREAISEVTRWGLSDLGLARVECGCYEDNLGSLRMLLRSGYVVEGFRRNAVIGADGKRQGLFLLARLAGDPPGHA